MTDDDKILESRYWFDADTSFAFYSPEHPRHPAGTLRASRMDEYPSGEAA
jgi:hypothetical protein